MELWMMIAAYLVRECALVSAQEQVEEQAKNCALRQDSTCSVIDISLYVFASYSIFDGVRYVKQLRCSGVCKAENGEQLLLDPQKSSAVSNIHIAKDHLGVRNVTFTSPNDVPSIKQVPGVWWTRISRVEGASEIMTRSDVSSINTFL
jgi:hypothetical protein